MGFFQQAPNETPDQSIIFDQFGIVDNQKDKSTKKKSMNTGEFKNKFKKTKPLLEIQKKESLKIKSPKKSIKELWKNYKRI